MASTAEFLTRSQRKVVDHCRQLLSQDGVSEPQAQRLNVLLATAEAELKRLEADIAAE